MIRDRQIPVQLSAYIRASGLHRVTGSKLAIAPRHFVYERGRR